MKSPDEISTEMQRLLNQIAEYKIKILDAIESDNYQKFSIYISHIDRFWIKYKVLEWVLNGK